MTNEELKKICKNERCSVFNLEKDRCGFRGDVKYLPCLVKPYAVSRALNGARDYKATKYMPKGED